MTNCPLCPTLTVGVHNSDPGPLTGVEVKVIEMCPNPGGLPIPLQEQHATAETYQFTINRGDTKYVDVIYKGWKGEEAMTIAGRFGRAIQIRTYRLVVEASSAQTLRSIFAAHRAFLGLAVGYWGCSEKG